MTEIHIQRQGVIGIVADYLMMPLMYLIQGTFKETAQRTHFWNNILLGAHVIRHLDDELLVSFEADKDAAPRWLAFLPLFHIPVFGGWKQYVVLSPHSPQDRWFVGWVAGDLAGASRIPLVGPVRVLLGSTPVQFFGVNEHGNQIDIDCLGRGVVGKADIEHRNITLL